MAMENIWKYTIHWIFLSKPPFVEDFPAMFDDKPAMHIQIIQETEVLDQSPKEEDHHEATGQQKIAPCHRLVLENGQI